MPRGPLNKNLKRRFRNRLTTPKGDAHTKIPDRWPADAEPPRPMNQDRLAKIEKDDKPRKLKSHRVH